MDKKNKHFGWDFFEGIYNETIRNGETFSHDMGKIIQDELEKMKKQRDEWLKNNNNNEKTNITNNSNG